MSDPKRERPVHNVGAFLGPDPIGVAAVPNLTLSDEYHDERAEPVDSSRVPDPEPPGLVRRLLDRLGRRS